MAYQTGAASGGADLLDKFRLFAISCGWTIDNYSSPTASTRWLHLHNAAGSHYDYYWDGGETIQMRGATGFLSSGGTWLNQPGSPLLATRCGVWLTTGSFPAYWFFGDDTQIMCVVERTTGVFRHFGHGVLNKAGTYTGGEWMAGTRFEPPLGPNYNQLPFDGSDYERYWPSALIRCEIETNRWWACTRYDHARSTSTNWGNSPLATANMRLGSNDSTIYNTPNSINALTPLADIRVAVRRSDSALYSPVGVVRNMRMCNIRLISPRDEIVFGTDTWKFFPGSVKATFVQSPFNGGSGDWGIAYKKVL